MSDVPPFSAFYRALHAGQDPFPWQERLAALVVDRGWPNEIGVPTGLGKTACLDIAVWSLAWQAATLGPHRWTPTRIWYVVNRRLLVDAAYDRATAMVNLLADPENIYLTWPNATEADRAALTQVAETLSRLAAVGSDSPLHLTRLRGGAELGARVPDPSQPALIFATIPMFASRWLFRGYGSSTSLRPVDAALAGIDSLVLLDEAHIAANLQTLASAGGPVELADPGEPNLVVPAGRSRPRLVALTATGRSGEVFHLDDRDLENPTVRQRITAAKRTRTASSVPKDLAKDLAEHALGSIEGSERRSCVVFCNTPVTARKVYEELSRRVHAREKSSGVRCDLLLLTGRFREREGARVRHQILDPGAGAPAGRAGARERDLVVVATQTLEVGADLDFDCLVTESAGARAITQRFGRLNRMGQRADAAAVVVHPETKDASPVYGLESEQVWQRIASAAAGGVVDLAPEAIAGVVGPPADSPKRVGELLPNHLWEWAKTSAPPRGEAEAELFYEGIENEGRVSVLWRAHIPEAGVRLVPAVHEDECVEVPVGEVREALSTLALPEVRRLTRDRSSLETVTDWRQLRPGDTIILEPATGLYDRLGWNPSSRECVLDVSPLVGPSLFLEPTAVRNLVPEPGDDLLEVVKNLREDDGVPLDPAEEADLLNQFRELLRAQLNWHPWLVDQEHKTLLDTFATPRSATIARPSDDLPYLKPGRRDRPQVLLRSDAFDELSFDSSRRAELVEHLHQVRTLASRMAEKMGCPPSLVEAVGLSGELHDIGKADPRFQRWLDPAGEGTTLLAKSDRPRERIEADRLAAGWPRGGRHEQLSGRLATVLLTQSGGEIEIDLVLHLIVSHHGHGRPFVPVVRDGSNALVSFQRNGAAAHAQSDLSLPDWDQPSRFRRLCERYGYWGLALLETIVRQADHAASQGVAEGTKEVI